MLWIQLQSLRMRVFKKKIKEGVWAFSSNNNSNGYISWWINAYPESVLIDCPLVIDQNIQILKKFSQGKSAPIILLNK